mmetsp:Transcript_29922/g.63688  ORF Transcript_29922/g.63688 Transcript_29922/m.63688 type:complete len:282 (+) Transcript_29922:3470-4315(+)
MASASMMGSGDPFGVSGACFGFGGESNLSWHWESSSTTAAESPESSTMSACQGFGARVSLWPARGEEGSPFLGEPSSSLMAGLDTTCPGKMAFSFPPKLALEFPEVPLELAASASGAGITLVERLPVIFRNQPPRSLFVSGCAFFFNSFCFSFSLCSKLSWTSSNFDINILKNMLRMSVCPNTSTRTKRMAANKGGLRTRIPAYMIAFQFSPVMIWNIVIKAQRKVSKCARGMQSSLPKPRALLLAPMHQDWPTSSVVSPKLSSTKWNRLAKNDMKASVKM